MSDNDLVHTIQRRASLRSLEEARRLLEGVLRALAYVLPTEQCDVVCACIPEDAVWCLRCGPSTPDPLVDNEVFMGWVMSSIETTGGADQTLGGEDPLAALADEEARARLRVVMDALWERLDAASRAGVAACLPDGVAAGAEHGELDRQAGGEP